MVLLRSDYLSDVISISIALDPSKVSILHVLCSTGRPLAIHEIVKLSGLNRKTIERHLESLKYLGFVYEEGRRYTLLRLVKLLAFFKVIFKNYLLVECVKLNGHSNHYFLRIMVLEENELEGRKFGFVPRGAIIIPSYNDFSTLMELYDFLLQKLANKSIELF